MSDTSETFDEHEHETAADTKRRLAGPLRRNWFLLVGVAVALVVGPWFGRVLDNYRAVVLDPQPERTLIGLNRERPPKWISGSHGKRGDIIVKEVGDWRPHVVERGPQDSELYKMHRRYNSTYVGTVQKINEPLVPKNPYVAIVLLDSGDTIRVELWGKHLGACKVGSRLEKKMGAWEPVLLNEGKEAIPTIDELPEP